MTQQTASQLLHEACGLPKVDGCDIINERLCWVCGGTTRVGMPIKSWLGPSFTDFNRASSPTSTHVCQACVFIASSNSPVPGRIPKEGKSLGGCFRNYSHMLDAVGYVNASKGEKPIILSWLRRPHVGPWFAAIADSGQIHTVPFCPVNPVGASRGVVLFERSVVVLPVGPGWGVVDRIAGLLSSGATKAEVTTGEYGARAWDLCREVLEQFETQCGQRLRGSGWFALAIWLAQRDEETVADRIATEKEKAKNGKAKRRTKGKAPNANGGSAAVAPPVVPADVREERPQELGHPRIEDACGSGNNDEPGGVVHRDAPWAKGRVDKRGQLKLFG